MGAQCDGVARGNGTACGSLAHHRPLHLVLYSAGNATAPQINQVFSYWRLHWKVPLGSADCDALGRGELSSSVIEGTDSENTGAQPAAQPLRPRIAFVVRGRIYEASSRPGSTAGGLLKPYTHSFLRAAWQSMRSNLILPARRGCNGSAVDIFVASHASLLSRLPQGYLQQLLHEVTLNLLAFEGIPDKQFALAAEVLQYFAVRSHVYSLVVVTRDDFVYDSGAWQVISTMYDPRAFNLVSNDCADNPWDGLHVLPASATMIVSSALRGCDWKDTGHGLARILTSRGVRWRVKYWFDGMYGAPDLCRPAMGYVDRGPENGARTFDDSVRYTYVRSCEASRRRRGAPIGNDTSRPCELCCTRSASGAVAAHPAPDHALNAGRVAHSSTGACPSGVNTTGWQTLPEWL